MVVFLFLVVKLSVHPRFRVGKLFEVMNNFVVVVFLGEIWLGVA